MTYGELFLGISTLVVALVAAGAVVQTYRIRKRDSEINHKITVLNEMDNCTLECIEAIVAFEAKLNELETDYMESLSQAVESRKRHEEILKFSLELKKSAAKFAEMIRETTDESTRNILEKRYNELLSKSEEAELIHYRDYPGDVSSDSISRKPFAYYLATVGLASIKLENLAEVAWTIDYLREPIKMALDDLKEFNHYVGQMDADLISTGDKSEIMGKTLQSLNNVRSTIFWIRAEVLS